MINGTHNLLSANYYLYQGSKNYGEIQALKCSNEDILKSQI